MGAVAIWSMHHIGNCAIDIANGEPDLLIEYRTSHTVGAFFLAITFVGFAFYAFGISESVSILWTTIGGLLVGTAICGMHYTSQQGIANYSLHYVLGSVVGAAVLAITASTVSLGLFFYLTSMWTNTWPRRLGCAAILAAGVFGMHMVATVGTSYRFKIDSTRHNRSLSPGTTALIVLGLVNTLHCPTDWGSLLTLFRPLDVVLASWLLLFSDNAQDPGLQQERRR